MANQIKLKKSSVSGKVPEPGDLQFGELALNYNDGKLYYKKSDGTTVDSFIAGGGSTSISWIKETSAYTATSGDYIISDTSAGAFTITLPSSPSVGAQVVIADGASWGANNLTIARNGSTIDSLSENLILDIDGAAVTFIYDGTTWEVYAQIGANGGTAVTLTGTQTLTNKTITNLIFDGDYTEEVFTITDGASVDLDPGNGTIQLWTLGASRSPTASSFANGQSMTLMIYVGTVYAITWPYSIYWIGGAAPTLATGGLTVIQLWRSDGSTIYPPGVIFGALVGDV